MDYILETMYFILETMEFSSKMMGYISEFIPTNGGIYPFKSD